MTFRDRDDDWIRELGDVVDTCLEYMEHKDQRKPITNFRHYVTDRVNNVIPAGKVFRVKESPDEYSIHSVKKKFRPPHINSIYMVEGTKPTSDVRINDDELSIRFAATLDRQGFHEYLNTHHGLNYDKTERRDVTYRDGHTDIIRVRGESSDQYRQIIIPADQTSGPELQKPTRTIINAIYKGEVHLSRPKNPGSQTHGQAIRPKRHLNLTQRQNYETQDDLVAKILYMKNRSKGDTVKVQDHYRRLKAMQGDKEDLSNAVIGQTGGIYDTST